MRRFSYLLMFILCVGITVSSCKKIDEEIKEDEPKTVEITSFTATLSPITKTELQDGYKVLWSPGDKISFFDYFGRKASFTSTNAEPAATANFTGSLSIALTDDYQAPYHHYYGIYPDSEQNSLRMKDDIPSSSSDNVIGYNVYLPSDQIAMPNTFANELAIAVGMSPSINGGGSTSGTLSFNNVCGLFEFTLEREDVTKVSFRANNDQALAGLLSVDLSAGSTVDTDGARIVTLSAPEGTCFQKNTPYYFVLPPVALPNGFTLIFTTDSGTLTKTIEKSLEIKKSVIGYMAAVDKDALPSYVPFADPLFKAYCVENFDVDGDGEISFAEALEVNEIACQGTRGGSAESQINDLTGIEYFTNLKKLDISYNNLAILDLSQNTALEELNCNANLQLTALNITNCQALVKLYCDYNTSLTSLDISNNSALTDIECVQTGITSLNASNHPVLKNITVVLCPSLASLDASNNPSLEMVWFYNSPLLASLELTNTPNLKTLLGENSGLTELDLSGHQALRDIQVNNTPLTTLNMSNCSVVDELYALLCNNCQLTSLVLDNAHLGQIDCSNNQLTSLDLSTAEMRSLNCSNNQLTSLPETLPSSLVSLNCSYNRLTSLSFSVGKMDINCSNNLLTSLEVHTASHNFTEYPVSVDCRNNQLTDLRVYGNALETLHCDVNQLVTLDISACPEVTLTCLDNPLEYIYVSPGQRGSITKPEGTQVVSMPGSGNQDYSRENWGDI